MQVQRLETPPAPTLAMNGLVRASRFGSEELEERFVCRSAALRGLVDAIERSSHAAAIFGRLSASTRQKLARLPPAWAMTSAMPFQELLGATAEECGERGVEQLAAASLKTGMLRFVGPLIRGLGRSGRLPPLQLFGQLVKILPSHLRGIDLELQSLGEQEMRLQLSK